MRITIPTNVDELIVLAKAILAKHQALAAASPLNGINGIANFQPQTTAADTNNTLAESLQKQAETAIEARDNALGSDLTTPGSVRYFVASSRDVLLGLNKGAEHNLGGWGFEVIASPKANGTATPPAADEPKK
jgi:hypothetical protein